jgi:hypothetical protein
MILSNPANIPALMKKWDRVLSLNESGVSAVTDRYKKIAMAVVLENQALENKKSSMQGYSSPGALNEAVPNNSTGGFPNANPNLKGYDPVLISLVRRVMPKLMAFDVAGVQPMNAPTGLIFAMKSKYTTQGGVEALHNEADTDFSGTGAHLDPLDPITLTMGGVGTGLTTAAGEDDIIPQMAFSIDKITVEAKTRALKAEYTVELADDLRAVHGLDAESELANILSSEILAEINREFIRTIYVSAVPGATYATLPGTIDLDNDTDGRWLVEKFKGLMFLLEKEANTIAKRTRRGRGNWIVCTSDVASALSSAGLLDTGTNLKDNLNVDDTGETFVGVLNNRFKVYIDPYVVNSNFLTVGFKGSTPYDAGLFYCPYVPLQMMRAVGQDNFQPKIAFKTRYGIVAHPYSNFAGNSNGAIVANTNEYFRKMAITSL